MDEDQTCGKANRASVDKRFIGKDPNVQEQQSNSGKADMSRQHE